MSPAGQLTAVRPVKSSFLELVTTAKFINSKSIHRMIRTKRSSLLVTMYTASFSLKTHDPNFTACTALCTVEIHILYHLLTFTAVVVCSKLSWWFY